MLLQIIVTVVKILLPCKRRKNEKCTRKPVTHKNAPLVPWLGGRKCSRGQKRAQTPRRTTTAAAAMFVDYHIQLLF